mgnify:CR=1 FL=1
METPKITIDGKSYGAKRPTAGAVRALIERDAADRANMTVADMLGSHIETLAKGYGLEASAIERMDIADIVPAYQAYAKWALGLVFSKLDKLPNAAGTAQ